MQQELRKAIAGYLSPESKRRFLSMVEFANVIHLPRTTLNRARLGQLVKATDGKVHLGCSGTRLRGFVNVDLRPTSATDVVMDCSRLTPFGDGSLTLLYSNAFFEHLYRRQQPELMREAVRALKPDGLLLFTGIPDFRGVARAYLQRAEPGHVSARFDAYEAYRYTHGDPDGAPGFWLAQLHKSLLDAETLATLARDAGFRNGLVFDYLWGGEQHRVTLGIVASRVQEISEMDLGELPIPAYARIKQDSLRAVLIWDQLGLRSVGTDTE
jgi:SAM-dependent methyltransferase